MANVFARSGRSNCARRRLENLALGADIQSKPITANAVPVAATSIKNRADSRGTLARRRFLLVCNTCPSSRTRARRTSAT